MRPEVTEFQNELDILISFVEGRLDGPALDTALSTESMQTLLGVFEEPRYPNLTNDHRRLTQQSRISLGGLVNSEGIIEQFLQKAEVEFEPVQRFRKIYSLYLKAVPDYLDPPLEFMTEKVLPLDSDLSDTRKKKLIKERLKQYFKFAQKPPKWIQDPEWPINNGEPLFFVGQVTINAPELFHDTGEAYVFYDAANGGFETVSQFY